MDNVFLAFVHKEQLARVKSVIWQACCNNRYVGRILAAPMLDHEENSVYSQEKEMEVRIRREI